MAAPPHFFLGDQQLVRALLTHVWDHSMRGRGTHLMLTSEAGGRPSPMRLLAMLSDRFGLFEALAYSTIKLNRCTQADELAMDPLVAEAILEFADDLRSARVAADEWAVSKGIAPQADAEGAD